MKAEKARAGFGITTDTRAETRILLPFALLRGRNRAGQHLARTQALKSGLK
jgi:hypothetical protein